MKRNHPYLAALTGLLFGLALAVTPAAASDTYTHIACSSNQPASVRAAKCITVEVQYDYKAGNSGATDLDRISAKLNTDQCTYKNANGSDHTVAGNQSATLDNGTTRFTRRWHFPAGCGIQIHTRQERWPQKDLIKYFTFDEAASNSNIKVCWDWYYHKDISCN